jgi:hypothetical protein
MCLFEFANQEPDSGYSYDGEEEALYPLYRPHRKLSDAE